MNDVRALYHQNVVHYFYCNNTHTNTVMEVLTLSLQGWKFKFWCNLYGKYEYFTNQKKVTL
jgi:hypothetical protein